MGQRQVRSSRWTAHFEASLISADQILVLPEILEHAVCGQLVNLEQELVPGGCVCDSVNELSFDQFLFSARVYLSVEFLSGVAHWEVSGCATLMLFLAHRGEVLQELVIGTRWLPVQVF